MATKRRLKVSDVTKEFRQSHEFYINELPWTEKQKGLIQVIRDKTTNIVLIKSPAGTGKTSLAIYGALTKLKEGKISKIYYLRSPVESCSKGIGFLPSDANSKMEPYFAPAVALFEEFLGKQFYEKLKKDNVIEIVPVGFIKGRTFKDCAVIVDEAEDLTMKDLSLVFGRFGKNSIMFVIGDERQSNIRGSGFVNTFNLFNDAESELNGIYTFEFTAADSMRSGISKYILEKFEKFEEIK